MTKEEIKNGIRNIPDFPVKGIQFKDVTTVLKKPAYLKWMRDELVKIYANKGITQVIGLESRGFIIGPALAMEIGAGFVPIRKPGKLPADTIKSSYQKEYGIDSIEMHRDALCPDDVVLLHDDLLATGGTMKAAIDLVKQLGVKKIYVNCIIELDFLKGREALGDDVEIETLIHF